MPDKTHIITAVAILAGIVLAGLCCGDCLYGTPGPDSGACMLDADTLRYSTLISVSGYLVPTHATAHVGNNGAPYNLFVSVEPMPDAEGMWRATFRNTHTGEEADQILPTCDDD